MTTMEEERWVYWRNKAKQLEEENEQLKQSNQVLSDMCDEYLSLKDFLENENEWLKEFIKSKYEAEYKDKEEKSDFE